MPQYPPLVLASGSPRRRKLLAENGVNFEVIPPQVSENLLQNEMPEDAGIRLARRKALSIAETYTNPVVLGADTLVGFEGRVLGKPASESEGLRMLQMLSGQVHRVITGVCLYQGDVQKEKSWCAITEVRFKRVTDVDIRSYLETVNTLDKAGGYAIQERGDMLVEEIDGSRSNVIGLPIEQVLACLHAWET